MSAVYIISNADGSARRPKGGRIWAMKFPSKANLERLRRTYPKGAKVCLLAMDDIQAPPVGTKGEVRGVDDAGNILVSWENGSSLSLIPGTDRFRILQKF